MPLRPRGVLLLLAGVALALVFGLQWFRRRNAAPSADDAVIPAGTGPRDRTVTGGAGDVPAHEWSAQGGHAGATLDATVTAVVPVVTAAPAGPADTPLDAATATDIDAGLRAGANANLPAAPSREDMVAAFAAIAPAVARCTDLRTRVVPVTVVLAGDGTVVRATPTANYPATGVADCVAQAARALRVPPFRSTQLTVVYPFLFD